MLIKTLTQLFVIVSAALILRLTVHSYKYNNCIMSLVALKEATQSSEQPAKNVVILMPNHL